LGLTSSSTLAFSATHLEASFAGVLESLGLAFTEARPLAPRSPTTRRARANYCGRPACPCRASSKSILRAGRRDRLPPYIVKPVSLGNSLRINARSVVDTFAQARRLADRTWRRFAVTSACDAFIVGREFHVGLVESGRGRFRLTAIVELHFKGAAPGRGFKTKAFQVKGERRRVFRSRCS
jgi:hypothetical protein